MDIIEKLKLCLLKLLNVNSLRFFGYVAYNLQFKIQENSKDVQENIKSILNFNKQTNKFELIFYESFLKKASIKEILFNIIHNTMHLLNQHNVRINGRDKNLFEIAADHVINQELFKAIEKNELSDIIFPNDEILIKCLFNKNYSTEEIYNFLLDNAKKEEQSLIQINIQTQSNSNQDNPEIKDNNDNNNNNKNENNDSDSNFEKTDQFDSFEKTKYKISYQYIENIDDIQSISNIQASTQLNEIKSSANLLLQQQSIQRGLKHGNLLNYLKNITKVEVPWNILLEKAILVNTTPNPDLRTWINPKKRFRAHNILLPGTGIDKSLETLVICIDTSGSISKEDLEKFAGIVLNSLSKFKKVWILKHSVKITQNIILNSNELDKFKIITNMKGGGGTSHKYVYDEIEKAFKKKELKLGLILFLTDFESDIERIYKNYIWTSIIPVIHIINNSKSILSYVPKDLDKNPILINSLDNN